MFLSRLTLNPRHPGARRDLANPYELHSTLARALEPDTGFLWRLEELTLLVQSRAHPDWGRLEPGFLARPSESKPLDLERLAAPGRPWRFRLRANPTVTRDGRRHGLTRLEDQLGWLRRQGERHGFRVLGVTVSAADRVRARKRQASAPITLQSVTFDGHLEATDPAQLAAVVRAGLGHGKALGLGLLSLAPARA